jgi:hypothetical protein
MKNLNWRQQYQVDTLLDCDKYASPEVLKRYFPAGMIGWDRYNNPRKLDTHFHSKSYDT